MKGINAYARPSPDGKGVTIDFERMVVDLAMVAKAGGYSRDQFLEFIGHVFDETKVDGASNSRRNRNDRQTETMVKTAPITRLSTRFTSSSNRGKTTSYVPTARQ